MYRYICVSVCVHVVRRSVKRLYSHIGHDLLNLCILSSLPVIVQELCESRGGRPGLSVLTSLLVSVDVKNY